MLCWGLNAARPIDILVPPHPSLFSSSANFFLRRDHSTDRASNGLGGIGLRNRGIGQPLHGGRWNASFCHLAWALSSGGMHGPSKCLSVCRCHEHGLHIALMGAGRYHVKDWCNDIQTLVGHIDGVLRTITTCSLTFDLCWPGPHHPDHTAGRCPRIALGRYVMAVYKSEDIPEKRSGIFSLFFG